MRKDITDAFNCFYSDPNHHEFNYLQSIGLWDLRAAFGRLGLQSIITICSCVSFEASRSVIKITARQNTKSFDGKGRGQEEVWLKFVLLGFHHSISLLFEARFITWLPKMYNRDCNLRCESSFPAKRAKNHEAQRILVNCIVQLRWKKSSWL